MGGRRWDPMLESKIGGSRWEPMLDASAQMAVSEMEKLERNTGGFHFSSCKKKGGKVFKGAWYYNGRKKGGEARRCRTVCRGHSQSEDEGRALFVLVGFNLFDDGLFVAPNQAEPGWLLRAAGLDMLADDLFTSGPVVI